MTQLIKLFLETLRKSIFSKQQLVIENLALRHQLLVYQRQAVKSQLPESGILKLFYRMRFICFFVFENRKYYLAQFIRNMADGNQMRFVLCTLFFIHCAEHGVF